MSEQLETAAGGPSVTAGGLLRQARQAKGLHIAALAAAIKVTPRKLELLESDQFDQLPDATFTRALAQTVCRTLKIDSAPVLALLPLPRGHRLDMVAEGLNTPFRERPGRLVPKEWASVASPSLWLVGLLLVGALALYAVPSSWLRWPASLSASGAADVPAAMIDPAPGSVVETPASASAPGSPPAYEPVLPSPAAVAAVVAPTAAQLPRGEAPAPTAMAASASGAAAAVSMLQVRTTSPSWVGVTDARGHAVIGRVLQSGEYVGVDAAPPLRLKIGNAAGTQIVYRGEPFELSPFTRDNVARFELR